MVVLFSALPTECYEVFVTLQKVQFAGKILAKHQTEIYVAQSIRNVKTLSKRRQKTSQIKTFITNAF